MAKPNLIGGAAYLKIDGVQHMSRGNWTYNFGKPTRTTVFDGANTVGYVEEPQEPMVEGDMTIPSTLDVGKLVESDDITLTLELDNGNVVVLRNAWFAGEGTVNVQEGSMPAKFVGRSLEVMR
jgi:Phage tail tube protein